MTDKSVLCVSPYTVHCCVVCAPLHCSLLCCVCPLALFTAVFDHRSSMIYGLMYLRYIDQANSITSFYSIMPFSKCRAMNCESNLHGWYLQFVGANCYTWRQLYGLRSDLHGRVTCNAFMVRGVTQTYAWPNTYSSATSHALHTHCTNHESRGTPHCVSHASRCAANQGALPCSAATFEL